MRIFSAAGLTAVLLIGPTVQAAPGRCADDSTPVYFERGSAELSRASVQVLRAAVERARACRVDGVTLVGRGDAAGPGRGDTVLARSRAETVAAALVDGGVPRSAVEVVVKPAEAQPRRVLERRVTVHMHLSPRQAAR